MAVSSNLYPINVVNFGQLLPEVPTNEPIGYWFIQGEVIGDASGGEARINFLLTSGADTFPFKGRSPLGVYLSVEEMRGRVDVAAALSAITKYLLIGGSLPRAFLVTGLAVLGCPVPGMAAVVAEDNNTPRSPYGNIFICTPGVTYSLTYGWSVNSLNATYNAYAWGFIWDVKSILELGGPKRPQGFNPF